MILLQLPWGAPVTDFPEQRLRGQTAMLAWELFTLIWILYIAFEVPYRYLSCPCHAAVAEGSALRMRCNCSAAGTALCYDVGSCVMRGRRAGFAIDDMPVCDEKWRQVCLGGRAASPVCLP